jgi:hypothetical protein
LAWHAGCWLLEVTTPIQLTVLKAPAMTYFTDASTKGRVFFAQLPWVIGIIEEPNARLLVGTAMRRGQTADGLALWSLKVRGADIPGRWVIIDGMFTMTSDEHARIEPALEGGEAMVESDLVCRYRQVLADTIERLQLPLDVVLSPVPPPTASWRVWRIEHDALQAALADLRRALCAGSRLIRDRPR